ncbi:hypothetical protein ACFLU8_02450 [Chloroflexota bacterium]
MEKLLIVQNGRPPKLLENDINGLGNLLQPLLAKEKEGQEEWLREL